MITDRITKFQHYFGRIFVFFMHHFIGIYEKKTTFIGALIGIVSVLKNKRIHFQDSNDVFPFIHIHNFMFAIQLQDDVPSNSYK